MNYWWVMIQSHSQLEIYVIRMLIVVDLTWQCIFLLCIVYTFLNRLRYLTATTFTHSHNATVFYLIVLNISFVNDNLIFIMSKFVNPILNATKMSDLLCMQILRQLILTEFRAQLVFNSCLSRNIYMFKWNFNHQDQKKVVKKVQRFSVCIEKVCIFGIFWGRE